MAEEKKKDAEEDVGETKDDRSCGEDGRYTPYSESEFDEGGTNKNATRHR